MILPKRLPLPLLRQAAPTLHTVASRGGVNSVLAGRAIGFENATTDNDAVFSSDEIDTVVITTRHDSHARLTCQALAAGKHVFVEKPLALTHHELDEVEASMAAEGGRETKAQHLMVGFNRRFSPFAIRMRDYLATVAEPKCLIATINAGAIPPEHWTQDLSQGGGRILGEGCHFIDLLRYLVGSPIVDCQAVQLGQPTADGIATDKCTITLSFADGSIGTLHYFANGPKALAKERIEAFAGGGYLQLDNFRALKAVGWPGVKAFKGRQDKGHAAAIKAFINAIRMGDSTPIPLSETIEVSRWTIRAAELATSGQKH